jgi:hypothetical protein
MRQLLGHLVDHLQIRREFLSVFLATYRFVGDGTGLRRRHPRPVRTELQVARGLVLLAYSDLGRPVVPRILCSDSSTGGFALHETDSTAAEILPLVRRRERWRFIDEPPVASAPGRSDLLDVDADFDVAPGCFTQWATEREHFVETFPP